MSTENLLREIYLTANHGLPGPAARQRHHAKLSAFVEQGRPIELVLPAFPAKSPNPRKTLSPAPDFGEVLALRRLEALCLRLGELHPAGARLTICSDGRVFSDLVRVPDAHVDSYGREIGEILAREGLSRLSTFDMHDAFPGRESTTQMREALCARYAEPLEALRTRVRAQADQTRLFNGIHRFLFEDQLDLIPGESRSQARERTKALAYEVIRRSNAWSRLIEERFPDALRLSIHPQAEDSPKIWIQLLPSSDAWRTPWHGVPLYDGNKFVLSRREEVEQLGARIDYARGRYPYFVHPCVPQGRVAHA